MIKVVELFEICNQRESTVCYLEMINRLKNVLCFLHLFTLKMSGKNNVLKEKQFILS